MSEPLPGLGYSDGVICDDPWTVACRDCGRTGTGKHVLLAILDGDDCRFHIGGPTAPTHACAGPAASLAAATATAASASEREPNIRRS